MPFGFASEPHQERLQAGVQVLEELLCHNDEPPHTWYLLALALYGAGSLEQAAQTLKYSRTLLCSQGPPGSQDTSLHDELKERIEEGVRELGDNT